MSFPPLPARFDFTRRVEQTVAYDLNWLLDAFNSGGAQGPQGPQGFQGAQGAQGTAGMQGSQGTQGAQGFQGAAGAQGAQGAQGTQGNQGSTGAQGAQGSQGTQGNQGAQGSQGAQGAQGTQGASGVGDWVRFAQVVTASSQATVTFTPPSGKSALKIIWFSRDTASGTAQNLVRLKLNSDGTSGNYTITSRIWSENTTPIVSTFASSALGGVIGVQPNDGNTAGMWGRGELTIIGYDSTAIFKECTATIAYRSANLAVGTNTFQWSSTAAITQLDIGTDGTAFKDGSTFTGYWLT